MCGIEMSTVAAFSAVTFMKIAAEFMVVTAELSVESLCGA